MDDSNISFRRLFGVMRKIEPQYPDALLIASDKLLFAVRRWSYGHYDTAHRHIYQIKN